MLSYVNVTFSGSTWGGRCGNNNRTENKKRNNTNNNNDTKHYIYTATTTTTTNDDNNNNNNKALTGLTGLLELRPGLLQHRLLLLAGSILQ